MLIRILLLQLNRNFPGIKGLISCLSKSNTKYVHDYSTIDCFFGNIVNRDDLLVINDAYEGSGKYV